MDKTLLKMAYDMGLEKYEGDANLATEFATGFSKEALNFNWGKFGEGLAGGAGTVLAGAGVGLATGLALHGISSGLQSGNDAMLKAKFDQALAQAVELSPVLQNADPAKVASFGRTVFQFAPNISTDPNLLAHVMSTIVHGESVDLVTIKTLADLESRYLETRKNNMFNPKVYK